MAIQPHVKASFDAYQIARPQRAWQRHDHYNGRSKNILTGAVDGTNHYIKWWDQPKQQLVWIVSDLHMGVGNPYLANHQFVVAVSKATKGVPRKDTGSKNVHSYFESLDDAFRYADTL